MSRIYLDTNVYVYYFGADAQFGEAARSIFLGLAKSPHRLFGSLYTLRELLVLPTRKNDEFRVAGLNGFFRSASVELLYFSLEASTIYAMLRAHHRVKAMDALHLACAATSGEDLFITNDKALMGLSVPGIGAIVGLDVSF